MTRLTIAALLLMLLQGPALGAYKGAKQNPNGTWVCGGAYTGAKQNPKGTWTCGGAYKGARQNPDGTWVCGGA